MLPGSPSIADAFDAKVDIVRPSAGLSLVRGHAASPEPHVLAAGGQVVTRMADSRTLLAILTFEATGALRAHPDIASAGQVSLDPERFQRFVELTGLDAQTHER